MRLQEMKILAHHHVYLAARSTDAAADLTIRQVQAAVAGSGVVADCPQRCGQQQRQAAGPGIGHKRHPGGQRKNQGGRDSYHPDSGRKENQPCKHLVQLLREACIKSARVAWQECGQLWEFVRPVVNKANLMNLPQRQIESDLPARRRLVSPWPGTFVCSRFAQGNLVQGTERAGYPLKDHAVAAALRSQLPETPGTIRDPATRRLKSVAQSGQRIRSLYKDCLSFVMPQQHNKSPAFDEDAD